MRRFIISIGLVVLTLGASACGGESEGGELNSNEGLHGFMNAIALDLAQVLADVAPAPETPTVKQGSTECPGGGGASWTEGTLGTGTLALSDCGMQGLQITGTLSGYLNTSPDGIDAQMVGGTVNVSGGFSGQLNVTQLLLQAPIPPTHDFTYWEVRATDANNKMLCAWSGGSGCGQTPPL